MAIAFDALSVHGPAISPSGTHTPVSTPKAIVALMPQDGVIDDDVTDVTYGGVPMEEVVVLPCDAGAETGALYGYFLGAGIPTGAQTVTVVDTANNKKLVVLSFTSDADETEVDCFETLDSAGVENPSVVLPTTTAAAIVGILLSGHNAAGSVAAGADYTEGDEEDFGSQIASVIRRTSNGAGGNITVDWVATSEEAGIIAIAIRDVPDPTIVMHRRYAKSDQRDPPPAIQVW